MTIDFGTLLEIPSAIPLFPETSHKQYGNYGAIKGMKLLRDVIAQYEEKRGVLLEPQPEQIQITHGATQALAIILEWHRGHTGGAVFIPCPTYPPYREQIKPHGSRAREYANEVLFSARLHTILGQLRATDLLIINSPHNPTGAALAPEGLLEILRASTTVGFYVALDAVYDEFCVTERALLSLTDFRNLFYINSVSKTFGAPDLRVGWIATSSSHRESFLSIAEHQTIVISQRNQGTAAKLLAASSAPARARALAKLRRSEKIIREHLSKIPHLSISGGHGPFAMVSLPEYVPVQRFNTVLKRTFNSHVLPANVFGIESNAFRLPLIMSETTAHFVAAAIRDAIDEIRAADLPLQLNEIFSAMVPNFLRLAESGVLHVLEAHKGWFTLEDIANEMPDREDVTLPARLGELVELGWLQIQHHKSRSYRLSLLGRTGIPFLYYFWLIEGGYGEVLRQGDKKLRSGVVVGRASCHISRFGAFPLINAYLSDLSSASHTVLDVGCGSGAGTILFAQTYPDIRVIGLERDSTLVSVANQVVSHCGLSRRVEFHVGDAFDSLPHITVEGSVIPVFSFVLHEILGQRGEVELVHYLSTVRRLYAGAPLIVIEPDIVDRDSIADLGDKATAFYDFYWVPYYKIHEITDQRLLSAAQWRTLFLKAGYKVIREESIGRIVDPCGIEKGFLLMPCAPDSGEFVLEESS